MGAPARALYYTAGASGRLFERQRGVGWNLRAEHVQRHRDQRIVAADADQFDHALVAERGLDATIGLVADPPRLVELAHEIDDRALVLGGRLRLASGLDFL